MCSPSSRSPDLEEEEERFFKTLRCDLMEMGTYDKSAVFTVQSS